VRIFDDFTLPGFWQDPFPAFERSFHQFKRIQSSPDGGVAVLGYSALRVIGMHPAIDGTPMGPPADGELRWSNEVLRHGLFTQIGPDHRILRKAVLAGLNNNVVKTFAPDMRELALRRLEELGGRSFDLFSDFCLPVAAQSWALFAGYGLDCALQLADDVEMFSRQLSLGSDPSSAEDADRAAAALLARTASAIANGGNCPAHRIARTLDDERGAPLVASLLFDAIDTAAAGIAGALAILLHEVGDRDRLACATYREQAIEEALRLATPAPFTVRQAREEVVLGELVIPRGALVWMWWSAGNRDPEVFPDPAMFRPGRAMRGLPFGIGSHSCVGHGWTKQLADTLVEVGLAGGKRLAVLSPEWTWDIGGARRPQGLKTIYR
jgi:cytochrome P450